MTLRRKSGHGVHDDQHDPRPTGRVGITVEAGARFCGALCLQAVMAVMTMIKGDGLVRTILSVFVLALALAVPGMARADIVGTYATTGTETDGSAEGPGTLKITAEPSGAYSVVWDGGDYVGVGQVAGDLFAVAVVADGKNTIMLMTIKPDGSLSGPWWRRKDPGKMGSETWVRK